MPNDNKSPNPGNESPRPPEDKERQKPPREIGGREGPDPTRYDDWEKNGRCIDF